MFIIDKKSFDRSMDKYIAKIRRRERGFSQIFSLFLRRYKSDYSVPDDLPEKVVHIERPKQGFFSKLFLGKPVGEQEKIEEQIQKQPEKVQEEMEKIAEEYQTLDDAEDNIEEKKEGLLSRFFKIFKSKGSEDVPVEQVEETISNHPAKNIEYNPAELREDLKKVSKIAFKVIQMLPKEKQAEFKQSHDFAEYKKILEKYGLVK